MVGVKRSPAPTAFIASRTPTTSWGAKAVHDDDVAQPRRWHEHLFDVGEVMDQ
jgi:hypothetical protein